MEKPNLTQQKQTLTDQKKCTTTQTTTVLRPFFRDHLGEPVPEENFWTLWCKGRHKTNTKKLKSGLVAFYDIWPENGAGLLSKEKVRKEADK